LLSLKRYSISPRNRIVPKSAGLTAIKVFRFENPADPGLPLRRTARRHRGDVYYGAQFLRVKVSGASVPQAGAPLREWSWIAWMRKRQMPF
jgi:hypothetical protein